MTDDLTAITLRPGDEGYSAAATTYMRTGRPAVVMRPRDAAEVAAAIQYATSHGLVLSVKSGGHNVLGFGTNDDGVVIDLSGFDSVDVLDDSTGTGPDRRRRRLGRCCGHAGRTGVVPDLW